MDTNFDIDMPGERLVLKENQRGNVRCKILQVERGVSLVGNVMADEVFMAGSFFGHMDTKVLRVGEHASLRGNLVYARLNKHPNAKPLSHGFIVDEKKFSAALLESQDPVPTPDPTPSPSLLATATASQETSEGQTKTRVLRLDF